MVVGWLVFADLKRGREFLSKRSVMLSGNINRDLFMYLKKKVDNLRPGTDYKLTFNVELATDLDEASGSSDGPVYLMAGASHREPKSLIENGNYVMNIDKGNAGTPGENMIVLADLLEGGGVTGVRTGKQQ